MPRTGRGARDGYCCHVLNPGNGRRTGFHQDGDFYAFVKRMTGAAAQVLRYRFHRDGDFCLLTNTCAADERVVLLTRAALVTPL